MRSRKERPTNIVGPRKGITAPSDRTAKDEHRDRIARDLARFLERGGSIKTLPGPAERIQTRAVGFGRGVRS